MSNSTNDDESAESSLMTQLDSSRGEAAEGLPTAAELLSKRRKRRTVEPTEIVAIKPQRTIVFSDIPAPPPSTPAPSAPEVSVEAARTTDATAPTEPNARNSWVNVDPNEEVSDDTTEGEAVDDAVLEVVAKKAETPPVPSVPPRPARAVHTDPRPAPAPPPRNRPATSEPSAPAVQSEPAPKAPDTPSATDPTPAASPAAPPVAPVAVVADDPVVTVADEKHEPVPASAVASGPLSADGKRRKRQWFEEIFNDDYPRTTPRLPRSVIEREVKFIDESLGCAKGAEILDLGCGAGEHCVQLSKRGYNVIGLDLSLSMLARSADEASEYDQKINFVQADFRELNFEDAFDGIYVWGSTFGYFDDAKNSEIIGRIFRALRPHGRLLLDVPNRDFYVSRVPSMAWFEGEGCVCMDEAIHNAINSRISVKRTIMLDDGRKREFEYSMRLYSLHELGKVLHDAGFRVVEVSGETVTPGVFFESESPRIIILVEK